MHVDDLAEACVYFMNKKTKESLINIGVGKDYTINEYAKRLLKILNIKAKIKHDLTKPDGIKKIVRYILSEKYGWKPKVKLNDGLISVYRKFFKNKLLITIITAVKNDKKNILKTINSVKNQNFRDYGI